VTSSFRQFTPDVLVDRTELRDTTTLATRLRDAPEWVLVALGVIAVAVGIRSRHRSDRTAGRDENG
jgi:apolipoprotein N-acyltransferase